MVKRSQYTRAPSLQQLSVLQEAGLIVMQLSSAGQPGSTQQVYDPQYSHVWVLLNSNPHKVAFEAPAGQTSQLLFCAQVTYLLHVPTVQHSILAECQGAR